MVRVLERVARLDAEERLVRVGVRRVEVVDVPRRDEREPSRGGELRQRLEDRLLHVEVRVLELDVGVVAAEDLLEPIELHLGVAQARLGDRLRDAAGETAGEGDQARRIALEQLPVDPWAVVVALQVPEGAELDEVAVAGGGLGKQGQMGGALRLPAAVVRDVDLAAEDRLHTLAARGLVEVDRAGQGAVVCERDARASRAAQPCRRVRGSCTPRRGSSTRSGRGGGRRGRSREGHRTAPMGRCPIAPITT